MELLEKYFDTAFAAPDGVQKLRELILTLAVQGKLVPQDLKEQPASELLKEIAAERQRLEKEKELRTAADEHISESEEYTGRPFGWKYCRLGNLARFIDYRGRTPEKVDSGIPLITAKNVRFGFINREPYEYITEDEYENWMTRGYPKLGDLLFTTEAPLGNIAVIDIQERFALAQRVICLQLHKPDIGSFLKWLIMSVSFQSQLLNNATGMTAKGIKSARLKEIPIPLPPLAEQHRIVAKIDQLMARCDDLEKLRGDRNQKRITIHTAALDRLLTAKESNDFSTAWRFITQHFGELYSVKENVAELRKAILQLAVMGKLVPQNPKDEPASELLKTIEAEKQRLVKKGKIKAQKPLPKISQEEIPYALPEGWKWVRMDDLCIGITSGSTPPNNIFSDKEGIPFLKVYNIRNQKIDFQYKPQFINEEYHLKSKRSCLNPGDVIMNIVGPPLGKVAIIPNHFPEYNCNQAIVFFRPVIKSLNEYLYLYLLSGKFLDKIELIGTAGQDNISVTKSRSILIPLAPLSEQLRIIKKTDFLMDLCDRLEKQIDAATSKRTELLKALMAQV